MILTVRVRVEHTSFCFLFLIEGREELSILHDLMFRSPPPSIIYEDVIFLEEDASKLEIELNRNVRVPSLHRPLVIAVKQKCVERVLGRQARRHSLTLDETLTTHVLMKVSLLDLSSVVV
jgi:hypothetical protein